AQQQQLAYCASLHMMPMGDASRREMRLAATALIDGLPGCRLGDTEAMCEVTLVAAQHLSPGSTTARLRLRLQAKAEYWGRVGRGEESLNPSFLSARECLAWFSAPWIPLGGHKAAERQALEAAALLVDGLLVGTQSPPGAGFQSAWPSLEGEFRSA